MKIYNHLSFNPHMENIQSVCNRLGGNTVWALYKVIYINEWENVAVFEAEDEKGDNQANLGKIAINQNLASLDKSSEKAEYINN